MPPAASVAACAQELLGFRSLRGRPGSVRGRLRFSFSLGFRGSVVLDCPTCCSLSSTYALGLVSSQRESGLAIDPLEIFLQAALDGDREELRYLVRVQLGECGAERIQPARA